MENKKDPSCELESDSSIQDQRSRTLLLFREHTFLLHLLYLLALHLLVFHLSSLRSILLLATVFFDHFCHCCFCLVLAKIMIRKLEVEGNTPISADRPRKGNDLDRGTGGANSEKVLRIFAFSCGRDRA